MSKTKTPFAVALLVLLGSMGMAQAQGNTFVTTEMVTDSKAAARMGGESEESGSIWLTFSTNDAIDTTTVTLDYSVPLAGAIASTAQDFTSVNATVAGTAKNDAPRGGNDGNGTVVISGINLSGAATTLVVRNVMLDVSGASGPVTVTAKIESSDDTDFLRFDGPNVGTVIDDIVVGVEAEAEAGTVRTRGTGSGGETATLTLEEAYSGAFMMGNELEIDFSGIPDEAKLTAELVGIKLPVAGGNGVEEVETANSDPYATIGAVSSSGTATVTLGGDDMSTDSDMRVAPEEVVLMLTLTAATADRDISFPLDVGEVTAEVTFAGEAFDDIFTDPVNVFNIRPAQCELLFPVVSVLPDAGNWDTAISVTNPEYTREKASGGLTFTFYGQDNPAVVYETTSVNTGTGLEADGTLAPGGTYQVLVSQLLAVVEWGAAFRGHVHLTADYTNCSGLGWVTDFMGVNQAYTATVIDLDTGKD